jgi:threonine/homoserine/homoserine lactone efflux protein
MSLLLAMFSFSLSMSISPGPINMIIVSSGLNYGVRKTFAFVSGATIGFTLLLLLIGLGFHKVISQHPTLLTYLGVAGSLFILYMGYLIISSDPKVSVEQQNRPGFFQGFLLQWLNPKAWMACVAGASLFSSADSNKQFLVFSLVYFIVCYASLFAWAVLGEKFSTVLNNEFRISVFNKIMGGLLVGTALFLLYALLMTNLF